MTQGEKDRTLVADCTLDGHRLWATSDGRFTIRQHPFEAGLLIEPEDWSFVVVKAVVEAGLDFTVRNVTEARARLIDIYKVLGWDADLRTS